MDIISFLSSSSLALIAVFTPIILALTQLVKMWVTNSRWAPLISVVFGILLAFFFSGIEQIPYRILLGVLSGLSASGLYSGVKTVAND